jgi:hypothetical protein
VETWAIGRGRIRGHDGAPTWKEARFHRLLCDTKSNRTQTSWACDNAGQLTGIVVCPGEGQPLGHDAALELTNLTALGRNEDSGGSSSPNFGGPPLLLVSSYRDLVLQALLSVAIVALLLPV